MKIWISVWFVAVAFLFQPVEAQAQSRSKEKGFDYKAHKHVNRQAQRWSKHRVKACKGDMLNLKCNARQSRQYARKHGQ
jgi:Flp pilus assembly protein TadB